METMFGKMMEGCMKGMTEQDKKKMMEKMVAMCPGAGGNLSEEDKKAMQEKMMAFCGSQMKTLSSFFSKCCAMPDQTCCDKKV